MFVVENKLTNFCDFQPEEDPSLAPTAGDGSFQFDPSATAPTGGFQFWSEVSMLLLRTVYNNFRLEFASKYYNITDPVS